MCGITYSKSESGIEAVGYADADWAEGHDRKSILGYVFMMSGGAIAWSAKKQGTIALSTLEAKYTAISHATWHIIWHCMFLNELDLDCNRPFQLHNNNHAAIALSHDPQFHGQSKHVNVRHHFFRDHIECGDLTISLLPVASGYIFVGYKYP